jgi:hypothetical protein
MLNHKTLAVGAVAIVAFSVTGVVLASTASTTVPELRAGEGQGAISGFDISTVHYELNRFDPSKIDAVTFMLDSNPPAGATIRIKVGSATATWYSCEAAAKVASCQTLSPPAQIDLANELRVIVAQ